MSSAGHGKSAYRVDIMPYRDSFLRQLSGFVEGSMSADHRRLEALRMEQVGRFESRYRPNSQDKRGPLWPDPVSGPTLVDSLSSSSNLDASYVIS